jgi:transcriptional regulator with XRE-family HTH domain
MTLKDLRRAVPLEQKELAVKIGVSALTISSWETGRRRPKAQHIRALALALGISTKELIVALDRTKMAHEVATSTRRSAGDSITAPHSA